MVYMPRKAAFIMILIMGVMCLVDGPSKKDMKETLVGVVCTGYALFTLVSDARKKKKAGQSQS